MGARHPPLPPGQVAARSLTTARAGGYNLNHSPQGGAPQTLPLRGKLKEGQGGVLPPLPRRPLRNPPSDSSMGGAGRSCLFSPREKTEMRGPLATTNAHRSPNPRRHPSFPRTRESTPPVGAPLVGARHPPLPPGQVAARSPPTARVGAHLNPPPKGEHLKPFPLWGKLKEGPGGLSLFSPREKIEMRGPASTTTRPSKPGNCLP